MQLRHLTTSALALIILSACSDATGVTVDDLTGTWTATSIVFTSTGTPPVVVDIVAEEQASLTLLFVADGTYTLTLTEPPDPVDIESGSYTVTGSLLTLSETGTGSPDAFTINRDGDTMILSKTDDFDFDDDLVDDPAQLVITLTR